MTAGRMRKRAEFLAAREGKRLQGPHFLVEARDRADGGNPRFGLTVTKKVGNAVERNRIRRRLREAIRTGAEAGMAEGFDYVVVARRELLDLPFEAIRAELARRFGRARPREVAEAAPQARPAATTRPADATRPTD